MELEFKSIQSATVSVSASAEVYNLTANVTYTNGVAQSVYEGNVTTTAEGTQVANFSSYDTNNLSINYTNANDAECDIIAVIKEFLEAVHNPQPSAIKLG
jgi:hypothetical protein